MTRFEECHLGIEMNFRHSFRIEDVSPRLSGTVVAGERAWARCSLERHRSRLLGSNVAVQMSGHDL
jgi:hypothetical protein